MTLYCESYGTAIVQMHMVWCVVILLLLLCSTRPHHSVAGVFDLGDRDRSTIDSSTPDLDVALQWSPITSITIPFINYSHSDVNRHSTTVSMSTEEEGLYLSDSEYNETTPEFTLDEIQLLHPPRTASELPWHSSHLLNGKSIAIVAAAYQEDVAWLSEQFPQFANLPYFQGHKTETTYWAYGHCNEASSYLAFISQWYDHLPDLMIFIHAHQHSWHRADMAAIMSELELRSNPLDDADVSKGYHSLNCGYVWGHDDDRDWHLISESWNDVFNYQVLDGKLEGPVKYYCCSEFLVDAAAIRQHSRQFYIDAYHWCRQTHLRPQHAGRMLEYTWHVMFGESAESPKCFGKHSVE